jgi:hypothetical protein
MNNKLRNVCRRHTCDAFVPLVSVILPRFHKLSNRARLLCSDGQLFICFKLVPHRKHSVTAGVLYRHLFLQISVRTSQRTLHYEDQWCAPVHVCTCAYVYVCMCVRVHVCTSSPTALLFFCTLSTKFWMHLNFGRDEFLLCTDRRTGCS